MAVPICLLPLSGGRRGPARGREIRSALRQRDWWSPLYTFRWDVGKDGTIDGAAADFATVFPVKGTYSIDAILVDDNGATAFVNLPIVVNPQPLVITASCSTRPGGAGGEAAGTTVILNCSASASGGTATYTFQWDVDKSGSIGGSGPTFQMELPDFGPHSIDVTVTDANGATASVNLPVGAD